ncbi:MAG: LamG domain-containing protein [Chitinophagaceae bacterium]
MCTRPYFPLLLLLFAGLVFFTSCKKSSTIPNFNADKSQLTSLVDSLTTVLNNAAEGTKPGDYAIGSKAGLKTSLDLAAQVISGRTFTQQQVNNALSNLERAAQQFTSSLIQEVSVANLVAQWKFNGDATDASGHHHDGVLKTGWVGNSASTAVDGGTLPQLVPDRFGRPNMAYDFNQGATIEVPYDIALNPQSFTISLWIKRHTTNSNNYMFSLDRWNGYKFQLQSNNFLFLTIHADNGYHDQDDNPGTIPQDVWTHAAVSYTNGTMKFYINGQLVKTAAVSGVPLTLTSPVNLSIGNELPKDAYNLTDPNSPNAFYGGDFFIGSLDDIRFYNTALTDAEILSIYTIESTP